MEVPPKSLGLIIGRSGSGKTTLLQVCLCVCLACVNACMYVCVCLYVCLCSRCAHRCMSVIGDGVYIQGKCLHHQPSVAQPRFLNCLNTIYG
jgi:energy-coupling factor transporter ATP-binding protein EcfA2